MTRSRCEYSVLVRIWWDTENGRRRGWRPRYCKRAGTHQRGDGFYCYQHAAMVDEHADTARRMLAVSAQWRASAGAR